MIKTVYKVKSHSEEEVIFIEREFNFLGLFKIPYIKKLESPEYVYWIEHRIDEGRYWYCEYKPVLKRIHKGKEVYEYKLHQHHSKQKTEKSATKIVEDIELRSEKNGYISDVITDSRSLRGLYL